MAGTLSQEAYNRVMAQAQKEGKGAMVDTQAKSLGISTPSSGIVSNASAQGLAP